MVQKVLKYLPFTSLFVTYFFICGCVYLIGFWGTFEIDISPFISLTDISKIFVYPFILSQAYGLSFLLLLTQFEKKNQGESHYDWMRRTNKNAYLQFKNAINIFIIVAFLFLLILNKTQKFNGFYWNFFCFLFTILLSIKLCEFDWLNDITKSTIFSLYIYFSIIYIPFASFQTGKISSINIYNNEDFKFVRHLPSKKDLSDTTKYKLLGFLGNKTFVSTLDNKKITIINQESFDIIEIQNK